MEKNKQKSLWLYFIIVTFFMFIFNFLFKVYSLKEDLIVSIISGLLTTLLFYVLNKSMLKHKIRLQQKENDNNLL